MLSHCPVRGTSPIWCSFEICMDVWMDLWIYVWMYDCVVCVNYVWMYACMHVSTTMGTCLIVAVLPLPCLNPSLRARLPPSLPLPPSLRSPLLSLPKSIPNRPRIGPESSRIDLEWASNRPQTDPESTPNLWQIDSETLPNRPRICPKATRSDPEASRRVAAAV